jgi:hypothetical protein
MQNAEVKGGENLNHGWTQIHTDAAFMIDDL